MQNNTDLAPEDTEEPGRRLREEARQSIHNALDMVSLSANLCGRHYAIVVSAPPQLGEDRFRATIAVLCAHVQRRAGNRWRIDADCLRTEEGWRGHVVLRPSKGLPYRDHEILDFLSDLGV